ncbi:MAG: hypothetical protein L6R40_002914 [Gallowayella cf. fulva]|nr:MAG: hypothetical protein L6R40_002914 [Xanthomendoza cf. fulva]
MSDGGKTSASLPRIRACIFDVDGLLINSEDIYTDIYNQILHSYDRPSLTWTTKALQQSRGTIGFERLISGTNLPLTVPELRAQVATHHAPFTKSQPLPGVLSLLSHLSSATPAVHLAMASSTTKPFFATKTSHLPSLTSHFTPLTCLFSDDADMQTKKGKPAGDIFLLAMERINSSLNATAGAESQKLRPEECLVFEDSIAGVAAGRAAGMRVCWVPHEGLREVCKGLEKDVLAGKMEEVEERLLAMETSAEPKAEVQMEAGGLGRGGELERIESDDGWAEMIESLESFDFERYGIRLVG